MTIDEAEACAALSRQLKSRVFTMLCDDHTGTHSYGFSDGGLVRVVAYVDGEVEVNKGPRQPEAASIRSCRWAPSVTAGCSLAHASYEDAWGPTAATCAGTRAGVSVDAEDWIVMEGE